MLSFPLQHVGSEGKRGGERVRGKRTICQLIV